MPSERPQFARIDALKCQQRGHLSAVINVRHDPPDGPLPQYDVFGQRISLKQIVHCPFIEQPLNGLPG